MASIRNLVTIMPVGTPYFSYLEALATDTHPPQLDREPAYDNWAARHSGTGIQSKLVEATTTALNAFDANPKQSTANTVYASLAVQNLELSEFLKSRTQASKDDLNLAHTTTRLLFDIANETPHRVVFVNAVAWLVVLLPDLDPALIRTAAFDDALTDAIWWVYGPAGSDSTGAIDPIVAALAKAGSYDARLWLCEHLDRDPNHDVKSAALRLGFSSATVASAELYGEPNEKFAPALVDFIQQTELHAQLQANEIDDELCHAIIDTLSEGICVCLVDGVELSFFRQHIPIEEIFRLSIHHLQERSLTLDELANCAWIYHVVFEEIDRWMREDADACFDENDLVISRNEHRDLAQLIRDIFKVPANKETLQTAFDAGGVAGADAKIALDRINGTYSASTYYLNR